MLRTTRSKNYACAVPGGSTACARQSGTCATGQSVNNRLASKLHNSATDNAAYNLNLLVGESHMSYCQFSR